MTMSNTNTQRAFTTTTATATSGSTHRPMAAANDGFFSFRPAMQGPPLMHSNHRSSSNSGGAMTTTTTTQQYRGQAFQNVYGPPSSLLLVPPSSAGFTNRPPPLPAGQTRLRFVDCLAWMVNSLTEGRDDHEHQHNKPVVWWSADGRAVYFSLDKGREEELSAAIRPFFKHGNFGSVRRQLFAYGFSKPLQGPNKKGFQHPHFRRGELTQENLKLIVRKIKGKSGRGGKRLEEEDNDEDMENEPSPSSGDEQSDNENMMTFKPTMKQQAHQLVKDLNSAISVSEEDGGILAERKSKSTKQTKKATRAVSLDQSDMAAVARLKSLRDAVPHQSIIDGNYHQQQNGNKENNNTPARTPPLPDYRREAKDPLQPAPYVLYPSESGGGAVKVTREWYVQTIQNTAASHCDVLVI